MTPENTDGNPDSKVDRNLELREQSSAITLQLDEFIEIGIASTLEQLENGHNLQSVFDDMAPLIEDMENFLRKDLNALMDEFDHDNINTFRLRLKLNAMVEEVLWRAIASFDHESEEARALLSRLQEQLYAHYVAGFEMIFVSSGIKIREQHRRGALQEATVASLLTRSNNKNAAVFISTLEEDKRNIDMKLFYLAQSGVRTENIQVKTFLTKASSVDTGDDITTIDGFMTGNLHLDEEGKRHYTWRTAKTLFKEVYGPSDTTQDEQKEDKAFIKSLLRYNNGRSALGWLNDFGKR